ncbi:MAG: CoA transferase [Sphingomonadaceae bacterium]|uniref:CaiB/BaiF CoA transferase family protein n=1 Tax=Thermaurantiacus sp. TaxID=2820283 RepID=UPI00298F102B|nr:CaiB/BaiF CoA-transferase family protein [Thermaurantiacus sp.]MCS6986650.1 CoA transferase [Sphingomonadaceae bacterium]MDW8414088.1 CaiB/BaiF CoA-transferase family protein [Thermaurantiacus sp.]
MQAPLAGIRVVEFTHMVMGPAAGQILADLGADVVKVEPIGGDATRRLKGSGAGYFPMYNRGKRSICLDLKHPVGRDVARRLAERADILVENFRPGAIEALGLGYDDLAPRNPGLIHVSEKGFLPGPYERRTALDEVAQMMGGLAYMTGPPGRPLRAGASVIDVTGGMFSVIAALAALQARQRTGRGARVTAALFETTVYLVGQHMAQKAVTGVAAAPMPARVSAWAIYDVFETKDDPLFLGVVTDALWEKFCALFDLPELWAREEWRTNNARVEARDEILPVVRARLRQFTRAELVAKLEGSGLPFAPIGRPEDLFDDPHLLASGGLQPVTLDDGTRTLLPVVPVSLDGVRPASSGELAAPGAHTDAILAELGLDPAELRASGAVA